MDELTAMKIGYDRKGSCGCHWMSHIYREVCPEHGRVHQVTWIMTIDELYKEYKILEALARRRIH